jgi:hypothetical protein
MTVGSRTAVLLFALAVSSGCERSTEPPENTTPSPNASILPAPLASEPPRVETTWPTVSAAPPRVKGPEQRSLADSGETAGQERADAAPRPVPLPLRGDEPLDADYLSARDLLGLSFEAQWHYPDLPQPPKTAEQSPAGLEAARKATALLWQIDIATSGRMRVVLPSRGFLVAPGTELRARVDRLGHVLVWPDGARYRTLPPGAARTLLGERRTDAIPLLMPRVTGPSEGPRRLGAPTYRWELSTRTGKLTLDQAHFGPGGEGATLLCRLLVELIAADPLGAPCSPEDVPLRAEYRFPQGAGIVFEVSTIGDRPALTSVQLGVPPQASSFVTVGLPTAASVLLSREALASMRQRPIDLGPPPPGAPPDGILAQNGTDMLRMLFVDSVPVATVAPGRIERIEGLVHGRYQIQWRTFLGDTTEPPQTIEVPARTSIGLGDAGSAKQ